MNSVNQTLQQNQVDALVSRGRRVDGNSTSLRDLGYNRIGLDDAWQACGKGVNGSFHDQTRKPLIRPDRFPDMAAMNAYATSKGVGSGWYLNTCDCCEKGHLAPMWSAPGDAKAVKDLGFDGLKLVRAFALLAPRPLAHVVRAIAGLVRAIAGPERVGAATECDRKSCACRKLFRQCELSAD
jgi:hypothetical protein